ncbi:unnamed protein product [Durusdinium trenchii]
MSAKVQMYRQPTPSMIKMPAPLAASQMPSFPMGTIGARPQNYPTGPLLSARPTYLPGGSTPMTKPMGSSAMIQMPRSVMGSYVANPQPYRVGGSSISLDVSMRYQPQISKSYAVQPLPDSRVQRPSVVQPSSVAIKPQPLASVVKRAEVAEAAKVLSTKLSTQMLEKPEVPAAKEAEPAKEVLDEAEPAPEPGRQATEMAANMPSNKEELENVVDNFKVEEQAKPLIDPAVSDSRIKSLAKRFSKVLTGCLFCK